MCLLKISPCLNFTGISCFNLNGKWKQLTLIESCFGWALKPHSIQLSQYVEKEFFGCRNFMEDQMEEA